MKRIQTSDIRKLALLSTYLAALSPVIFLAIELIPNEGSPLEEGGLAAAGTLFSLGCYALLVLADFNAIRKAVAGGGAVRLAFVSFLWLLPLMTFWGCAFMYYREAPWRVESIMWSLGLGIPFALKLGINLALLFVVIRDNRRNVVENNG